MIITYKKNHSWSGFEIVTNSIYYSYGRSTLSITCTTPLYACRSTATMFDSLPLESISLAPLDKDTLIGEPIVVTDIPSTKSVDLTLAPGTTCVPNVASKVERGISPKAFNPS